MSIASISWSTRPSDTRCATNVMSLSWSTVPKKFFKSASTTHTHPSCSSRQILPMASLADRPRRYPKLASSNTGSKIGSSRFSNACWHTRSYMAGMPNGRYFPGWPDLGISFCRTGCGRYVSVFNSACRRSRRSCKPSSNSSRVSPSTPPAPLLRRTFSQASKRFFGLYTLSTNEWTFLAHVGFTQSLSLLGREVPGFSLMELILPRVLAPLIFQLPPTTFAGRLPQPTRLPRQQRGHAALAALPVLFDRPTPRPASLPTSRNAYRVACPSCHSGNRARSPGVTPKSSVPCRPQTPWCGGGMRAPSPP